MGDHTVLLVALLATAFPGLLHCYGPPSSGIKGKKPNPEPASVPVQATPEQLGISYSGFVSAPSFVSAQNTVTFSGASSGEGTPHSEGTVSSSAPGSIPVQNLPQNVQSGPFWWQGPESPFKNENGQIVCSPTDSSCVESKSYGPHSGSGIKKPTGSPVQEIPTTIGCSGANCHGANNPNYAQNPFLSGGVSPQPGQSHPINPGQGSPAAPAPKPDYSQNPFLNGGVPQKPIQSNPNIPGSGSPTSGVPALSSTKPDYSQNPFLSGGVSQKPVSQGNPNAPDTGNTGASAPANPDYSQNPFLSGGVSQKPIQGNTNPGNHGNPISPGVPAPSKPDYSQNPFLSGGTGAAPVQQQGSFEQGNALPCNQGTLCVATYLCVNGELDQSAALQAKSQEAPCNNAGEVCCRVPTRTEGTIHQQPQHGSPGLIHITPAPGSNPSLVQVNPAPIPAGGAIRHPSTQGGASYNQPQGAKPSYPNQVGAASSPSGSSYNPSQSGNAFNPAQVAVTSRPVGNPIPQQPYTGPQNVTPHPGCAAALKCVPLEYCTWEGVMTDKPVALTREESDSRVPLSECVNPETNVIGKCCRDPNYKDPWPDMLGGPGGGHHHHHPGSAGATTSQCGQDARCEAAYQCAQTRRTQPQQSCKAHDGAPGVCCVGSPVQSASNNGGNIYYQNKPTPVAQPPRTDVQQPNFPQKQPVDSSYPQALPSQPTFPQQPAQQPDFSQQQKPALPPAYPQTSPVQSNFPQNPSSGFVQQPQKPQQPGFVQQPQQPGLIQKPISQQPSQIEFVQQPQPQVPDYEQKQNPATFPLEQATEAPAFVEPILPDKLFNSQTLLVPAQYPQLSKQNRPGSTCGVRRVTQDSGLAGEDGQTVPGEFPWLALVVLPTNSSRLCAGAIISDKAVLTSAHCVLGIAPEELLIQVGSWTPYQSNPDKQEVRVAAVAKHPNYEPTSQFNDLAVLLLASPLRRAAHVDTVCLPDAEQISPEGALLSPGGACVIASWPKQGGSDSYIHRLAVHSVSQSQCQEQLRTTYLGKYFQLNRSFTCATPLNPQHDICSVALGGPLVCPQQDGRYVVMGATSWDVGCQERTSPAVMSALDVAWINEVLTRPVDDFIQTQEQQQVNVVDPEVAKKKPGFSQGYGK